MATTNVRKTRRGSALVGLAVLALVLSAGLSAALAFPQVWSKAAGVAGSALASTADAPAQGHPAPSVERPAFPERQHRHWEGDDGDDD